MTRGEARSAGLKTYNGGRPCKVHGPAIRYVSTGMCLACLRSYTTKYEAENPDRRRQLARQRYAANIEEFRNKVRTWRENNRHKTRRACANWAKKNKDKVSLRSAIRHKRTRRATPPWVDSIALEEIYEQARKRSRESSIKYNVDHIVPLTHALVCGLHVPWNLQILSAEENARKKNKFTPGTQEEL
jgi:hypothetical protein